MNRIERRNLQKDKKTLGFYSILTSEVDKEDKGIINRYHGLSRIEDSFRIIKASFRMKCTP